MKITSLATITTLIFGATVSPSSNAQDVEYYSVNKTQFLTQTSTAAPTLDSFGFGAVVAQASGGSLISASVSLPAGSTNSSPVALGPIGNGNLAFASSSSPTQAGLDARFNNGTYGFSITGGSGSYSGSVLLTGDTYPAPVPTVTNTNWSGGALVVDPSQNFTLTWNSFSNFGAGDSVGLQDNSDTVQFSYNTNTTSQLFAAGSLAPNTSYAFTLYFEDFTNINTSSIPDAPGNASYIDNTRFTVQTVPEPSTTAILFIGIGFLYFVICRRKNGLTMRCS